MTVTVKIQEAFNEEHPNSTKRIVYGLSIYSLQYMNSGVVNMTSTIQYMTSTYGHGEAVDGRALLSLNGLVDQHCDGRKRKIPC